MKAKLLLVSSLIALNAFSINSVEASPLNTPECNEKQEPFCQLHREMTKSFTRFFSKADFTPLAKLRNNTRGLLLEPNTELLNKRDEIIVKIDLPGVNKNDMELSLYEDYLLISATRQQQKKEDGENYQLSELSYGSFSRIISFPAKVDIDGAKTSYKNGVLTVTIPKIEPQKPKFRKLDV